MGRGRYSKLAKESSAARLLTTIHGGEALSEGGGDTTLRIDGSDIEANKTMMRAKNTGDRARGCCTWDSINAEETRQRMQKTLQARRAKK